MDFLQMCVILNFSGIFTIVVLNVSAEDEILTAWKSVGRLQATITIIATLNITLVQQ